mmetsp:Transcript_72755/g.210645  ORF Transcript_72755/g.210645 Transcript_72755/m.210645 type:complete len:290 (-) Transcript_72755:6-875(-)
MIPDHSRFDVDATPILRPHSLQDRLDQLVGHMCNVSAAFDRVNGVHKAHLLERAICDAHSNFPTRAATLVNAWSAIFIMPSMQVEVNVVLEAGDRQSAPIENDFATRIGGPSDVKHALHHQAIDVFVNACHAELSKVGVETYPSEFLAVVVNDLWRVLLRHVRLECLLVFLPRPSISGLDDELRREDICQLCAEAISAARHLLLGVIIIVAGEQVAEDQFRHVAIVLPVHLHGNPCSIVHDGDKTGATIDCHIYQVHAPRVAHHVVRRINQDLVKDLVQCWDIGYSPED